MQTLEPLMMQNSLPAQSLLLPDTEFWLVTKVVEMH